MQDASMNYANIRNNFLTINRAYILQGADNSRLATRDTFQAHCDVYNHQYYGSGGSSRLETEDECLEFLGEVNVDLVLRLMCEFVVEMTGTIENLEMATIVNAWRYEQISALSSGNLYYEIANERSIDY